MHSAPIPFTSVCPLTCLPLRYVTPLQVLEACPHSFPAFPYTHAYATAQPFIGFPQKVAHIGKSKVVHPPSDCIGKFLLALLVAPTITARCHLFKFCFQLGLGLRMNAQASLAPSHIERVSEEFLPMNAAYMRFLAVYFQKEFSLYKLGDTVAHPFSRSRAFPEYDTVISVAHKRQAAAFKFAD